MNLMTFVSFVLAPKWFMIYSQRNSVVRFVPDSVDCPEAVLPIQNLKGIKAINFDPVTHYLYWVSYCFCFSTPIFSLSGH